MGTSQATAPADEITAMESRVLAATDLMFSRSAEEAALFEGIITLPQSSESPRRATPPQSSVLAERFRPDPRLVSAFRRQTTSPTHAEMFNSELARHQQALLTALPYGHTLASTSTVEFGMEKVKWKTECDEELRTVVFNSHDNLEPTKPDIIKCPGSTALLRHSNAEWSEGTEKLLAKYADEHV